MNTSLPSILLYLLLLAGVLLFVQQQVDSQLAETKPSPPAEPISTSEGVAAQAEARGLEIHYQLKCEDPGQAIGERKTTTAYRWQDDKGQWHFSDKPQKSSAEGFELHSRDQRYFTLDIALVGTIAQHDLDSKLRIAVEKTYHLIAELLPEEALRRVAVSLKVFGDKARYNNFREQYLGGQIAWADGFYHSKDNTAAVLWRNKAQAQAVALHESIHVINFGLIGIMPRWLNEGMAEYLENLNVIGQGAEIPLSARSAMRQQLSAPLNAIFQDHHPHWRNQHRVSLYQSSWALTAFLMESDEGRAHLRRLLSSLSKQRCQSINSLHWFNEHYPGGTIALEKAVALWLRQSEPAIHRF